jgi:hypothetical protein
VEYTLDGGATWELLYQLPPSGAWTEVIVDISAFVGANGPASIWFAFHSDDGGEWASGWCIDNVKIQVPAPPASYIDYFVFLDDAFVGSTTVETWDYAPLTYGQVYTASVAARYTSGLSAKDYYTFQSRFLFPPLNLTAVAPDDAGILMWEPPLTFVDMAQGGMSYQEYLDKYNLAEVNAPAALSAGLAPSVNPNELPGVPVIGRDVESKAWGYNAYPETWPATFILNNPGDLTQLGGPATDFIAGADIVDGVYYGHVYGGTWVTMDTATGEFTYVGSCLDMTGIAYDFTEDIMYGVDFNGNLYTVELETGATTLVGNGGALYIDCACDNDGNLYGFDINTDVFGSIDKATGAFTTIAPMPFNANYAQGAGCDHDANVIYHAAYNNSLGAGQLYIVDQVTGAYTLVGNFEGNAEVDGFAVGVEPGGGGGGDIPDGLLGYNVYRNGGYINYVEYIEDVPATYVDENLDPGNYCYTVTAVYDLGFYGFPGETDESMEEGPACVDVDYCYELEFMETWDLGSFDVNQWESDGVHWIVNGLDGNPAPVAEFTWDPVATDYGFSLESYPLCAVGIVEGNIWLDFDLALESVNPTGAEMLHAQVWNWESQEWMTVASYSNVDGSFDWTSEHVKITALAKNKVFKIRFHAMGVNTLDIVGWMVDNIHVYRVCDAATDLTVEDEYPGFRLNWVAPEGGSVAEWIHWDDGENWGGIGTNSAAQFDVAARWEPSHLVNYDGAAVTQVAFFPYEELATYTIRIWTGPMAANLVVEQDVPSPVINEWNYVMLDTPVPIDITEELWVGYYIDAQAGYPAGCDDGPAVDEYGDWINLGGWQTLLEIDPSLDHNWNIQAYVETLAGVTMPMGRVQEPRMAAPGQTLASDNTVESAHPQFAGAQGGSRELTGYNVWRNVDGGAYEIIDFSAEPTYFDEGPFVTGSLYCYMVQAVYQDEETGDYCESAPSNEACILSTSIVDPNATVTFSVYPNPATSHVFVVASAGLERVTVYNALGQLVRDQVVEGSQYELNTRGYTPGVYMIRVETAGRVETRTLTIQR